MQSRRLAFVSVSPILIFDNFHLQMASPRSANPRRILIKSIKIITSIAIPMVIMYVVIFGTSSKKRNIFAYSHTHSTLNLHTHINSCHHGCALLATINSSTVFSIQNENLFSYSFSKFYEQKTNITMFGEMIFLYIQCQNVRNYLINANEYDKDFF